MIAHLKAAGILSGIIAAVALIAAYPFVGVVAIAVMGLWVWYSTILDRVRS
jgi:hypothetical protein